MTEPTPQASTATDTETLRDRFAMACLTGIISSGKLNHKDLNAACFAYKMADAMLAERSR